MYETLIMLKPDQQFSMTEMEQLVQDVCSNGQAQVSLSGETLHVEDSGAVLMISFSDGDWVAEEAQELAQRKNLPTQGVTVRYEMNGRDEDMQLYNDYLLINERLDATGKFIIFDQFTGQLFGTV